MLRPTPGDPWGVEQHYWNTGAKEKQQLNSGGPSNRHKSSSRKLLNIKVTPDLHLTYSKNGGNLGLVLTMKNIACISILLTKHVKYTYLYLFKFVLYSIVAYKQSNKLNGHKTII